MLHVTYVMFPGVHLLFVFFCELSFSILHAYFCMILTNVFFIPCNRYVWNSLDHLPHVFIYVDACLGHQFCLWHGICIYIFKLLLPLQFGDLGIVRFSNVLVRYLRVVQQVEPYDLFLKNLKSDNVWKVVTLHGFVTLWSLQTDNRWSHAAPSSWPLNVSVFWFLFSVHMVVILYVKSP